MKAPEHGRRRLGRRLSCVAVAVAISAELVALVPAPVAAAERTAEQAARGKPPRVPQPEPQPFPGESPYPASDPVTLPPEVLTPEPTGPRPIGSINATVESPPAELAEATPGPAVTEVAPEVPDEGWTTFTHWRRDRRGRATVEVYAEPAFRRNGSGWAPIDGETRATTGRGAARSTESLRPIVIGDDPSRLAVLELDGGDVVLSAPELASPSSARLSSTDEVVLDDVAADTDVQYEVTAAGLKELVILHSEAAPRSFRFHLSDPNGVLGDAVATSDGGVSFTNLIDDAALVIPPPFAYEQAITDDSGADTSVLPPRDLSSAHMDVVRGGDGWDLTVAIDDAWLEGRQFPIVLDPTFTFSGAPLYDAAYANGISTLLEGADINGTGRWVSSLSTQDPLRSAFFLNTAAFLAPGSVVNSANLQLFHFGCLADQGSYPCNDFGYDLELRRFTGGWDSHAATWAQLAAVSSPSAFETQRLNAFPGCLRGAATPFNIQPEVQGWVSGPTTNFGFFLTVADNAAPNSGGPVYTSNESHAGTDDPVCNYPAAGQAVPRPHINLTYVAAPFAPTNVRATASNQSAIVSWSASNPSYGGAAITRYEVQRYIQNNVSPFQWLAVGTPHNCGLTTTCTVPSLTNGRNYRFQVRAQNSDGLYSAWSPNSNVVVPFAAPTIVKTLISPPLEGVYSRGQLARWLITVTNPDTTNVTIGSLTDTLGAGLAQGAAAEVFRVVGGLRTLCLVGCSLTGGTLSISNVGVLTPGQSVSYEVSTVVEGVAGYCSYLANVARMQSSKTGALWIDSNAAGLIACDSGLGREDWWSFVDRRTGPTETVGVNMSNLNAVVQATDSTPTAAHGDLALTMGRTYNSQGTDLISMPGSIGANWRLNLGSVSDLAGLGITPEALSIPSLSDVLNNVLFPASVTMTDRDGTRHLFTSKATMVDTSRINISDLIAGGSLSDLIPRVLRVVGDAAQFSICIEQTFQSPPGVNMSLYRYVQVKATGSGACNASVVNNPNNAAEPAVLGFVAIRPDRLRTEFSADGRLLSMTDGAGNELRYAYTGSLPLLGGLLNPLGRLAAVYEVSPTCQPPLANPHAVPTNINGIGCRAIKLTWPTVADGDGLWSLDIVDAAGRTTTYRMSANPLGGIGQLPSTSTQLREVLDDAQALTGIDATTTAPTRGRTIYEYGSTCAGSNAAPNQLCSITDPRGNTTRLTYTPTFAFLPTLATLTDRRGFTTTFGISNTQSVAIQGNHASRFLFNTDANGFVDGTGRMKEIDEGTVANLQVGSTTNWARQTLYVWDSPTVTCRLPDQIPDNNLCQLVQSRTPNADRVTTVANGDRYESYLYNEAGQLVTNLRVIRDPFLSTQVNEITTYGHHVQHFQADGTVRAYDDVVRGNGGQLQFPPFATGGTGTRIDPYTMYVISDRTQTLPPRGNDPTNAATYAQYVTTEVRDVPAGNTALNPNLRPAGPPCQTATRYNTGLLCETRAPASSPTSGPTVTRYVYDTFGQRTAMTTPRGHTYGYAYYGDGDTDLSGTANASGWLRTVTDPTGAFVAYQYDAAGNPARTFDRNGTAGFAAGSFTATSAPAGAEHAEVRREAHPAQGEAVPAFARPWRYVLSSTTQVGNRTAMAVDHDGNVLRSRSPRGFDTVSTFDPGGRELTRLLPVEAAGGGQRWTYGYDQFGNQTSVVDPNGRVQTMAYDAVNRRTQRAFTRGAWPSTTAEQARLVPVACAQSTAASAPIPAGRILCHEDWAYTGLDDVLAHADGDAQLTYTDYDGVRRPTVVTRRRNDGTIDWTTTRTNYDLDGHVLDECRANSSWASLPCNPSTTWSVHHTYDVAGREATRFTHRNPFGVPSTETTTFGYDPNGNQIAVTNPNGRTTTHEFDQLDRMRSVTVPRDDNHSNTTFHDYDPAGNRIATVAPGGVNVGTGADGDRVVDGTVADPANGNQTPTQATPLLLPEPGKPNANYRNLTLRNGAWIRVSSLATIHASGTLDICATCGVIVGNGPGGGAFGTNQNQAGTAGGDAVPGGGGAGGAGNANTGRGGGGGGHGSNGTAGPGGGAGGASYAATNPPTTLTNLQGSGGGGGGGAGLLLPARGGPGGAGGGSVHLSASRLIIAGTVSASGAGGGAGVAGLVAGGGGGGGSGGGIWLTAQQLDLSGTLNVDGGAGAPAAGSGGAGGAGAAGRVYVEADRVTGSGSSAIPTGGCTGTTCRAYTGRVTLASFDASHRVVDTVEGATAVADPATLLATADGGTNVRTRRFYDADSNVVGVIGPRGFTTSVNGDPRFLVRADHDANGRLIAEYRSRYDTADPALNDATGGLSGEQSTQCPTGNPAGGAPSLPAYPGTVGVCRTTYQYDPAGNRTRQDLPTRPGSSAERYISFTYTDDNLVATVNTPSPTGTGRVDAASYAYDGTRQVTSITDPLGYQRRTRYSADDLAIETSEYAGATNQFHDVDTRRDANGNVTRTVAYHVRRGVNDPLDVITDTVHYGDDRRAYQDVRDVTPTGATTVNRTAWFYDPAGNLTATRTPSASAAADAIVLGQTPPDANNRVGTAVTATYTHDNLVQTQSTLVDPNGNGTRTVHYTYDAAGRVSTQRTTGPITGNAAADGGTQGFTWYPNDRMRTETGRDGEVITHTYTAEGLRASVAQSASATVQATWHLDGLSRTVSDGRGHDQAFSYDGNGVPSARRDNGGTAGTVTYAHNDAGLATGWSSSLAGTTARSYTATGLPASQTNPDTTVDTWTYETDYDLSSRSRVRATTTVARFGYTYDPLRRIRSQTFSGQPASGTFPTGFTTTYSYTYTPSGRLASYTDNTGSHALTWDHDGNRLSVGGTGGTTFTYRADGSVASEAGVAYKYDAAGRLLADRTACYLFDGFDRRVAFTTGSTANPCPQNTATTTTTYTYDGLDRQTSHTEPAATNRAPINVHYSGLSTQVVAEDGSGTGTHPSTGTYVLGPDGAPTALLSHPLVSGSRPDRLEHLADDGQGTISTATSSTGQPTCAARFDPFGRPVQAVSGTTGNGVCASVPGTTPASVNDQWFRGGRRDQSTGQYQFGSRTYDPGKNIWLTPDTYRGAGGTTNLSVGTDPLTSNTYVYVNGDPINLVDDDGHWGRRWWRRWTRGRRPRPATHTFEIPQRSDLGVIQANLFIQAGEVGGVLNPSRGDNRGFSPTATCDQSRACVILDFERGVGYVQVTGSCRASGACFDAYRLNGNVNRLTVKVTDEGIDIRLKAKHADPSLQNTINPLQIDFRMQVVYDHPRPNYVMDTSTPASGLEYLHQQNAGTTPTPAIIAHMEDYPSLEVYQRRRGQTITRIQDREQDAIAGFPIGLGFGIGPLDWLFGNPEPHLVYLD